jgi:hypothetical protein
MNCTCHTHCNCSSNEKPQEKQSESWFWKGVEVVTNTPFVAIEKASDAIFEGIDRATGGLPKK